MGQNKTEVDFTQERPSDELLRQAATKLISGGAIDVQKDDAFANAIIKVVNGKTTLQEKVSSLRNIQLLLLIPQVNSLEGMDDIDFVKDKKRKQAQEISESIDRVIKGIYDLQDFTNREEIDFKHPKIQKAFEFMVEGVLEIMKQMKLGDDVINEFINRFSTSMIGFEEGVDKRLRGVSNNTLHMIKNPLMEKYRDTKEQGEEGVAADNEFKVVNKLFPEE